VAAVRPVLSHCHLCFKLFFSSRTSHYPLSSHVPPTPPSATTELFSVSMDLSLLNISLKRSYRIQNLLCLASFIWYVSFYLFIYLPFVLRFELRACTLSHSTSPFFVMGFFLKTSPSFHLIGLSRSSANGTVPAQVMRESLTPSKT
jgi:hypothetical protein